MVDYNIYPSVDENLNFPPSLRAAMAAYPEFSERFMSKSNPTLENASFTGNTTGITAAMVGLGNVNNTADANKPVSTAMQTALNLKAPINNPTFTGSVKGITAGMVGLGNINNTSDANKPVSTAQATAINNTSLGLGAIEELIYATPTMTGVTVVLNIPRFTFLANRWYEIEFNGTVINSATSSGRIITTIYQTIVNADATSTVGLTELGNYHMFPTGSNIGWRVSAKRKIKYPTNSTYQIKAITNSSNTHYVEGTDGHPAQLSITDLGLMA